jgi:1-phosphatidylinositol phosphodiesterase
MGLSRHRFGALARVVMTLGLACGFAVSAARPGHAIQLLDENSQSGSYFSTDGAPKGWLVAAVNNWMGGLPDSTPLSAMSIPGTHDSGAMHGGLAVQTQSWTIAEQLQAGLRYFDIRTRRTKNSLAIHHGPFFQKQMFGDVMNAVTAFLRAHPTETVLMRVKEEYTAEKGSASYGDIWAGYMKRYGNYVYKGNGSFPTLGQIRGKILVLRNADFSGYGVTYSENTIQDYYKVYFLPNRMKRGDQVSLPTKKDEVAKYLDLAARSRTGKLVLNHLSGAVGMAPKDVARATDHSAYDHIGPYNGRKTLGVVIMDFPGDRLVYRIIKTNFTFAGSCPARTFRSVSAHSWVEFRLPKAGLGHVIEISGGAYNHYVFPKCNRVHWSDLSFSCGTNGQWTRTKGSWDSDALCHGSKGSSPYVAVGNR